MDAHEYKEIMKVKLTAAFDFPEPPDELKFPCDLWAAHHRSSEKYFLSKKVSLYTMDHNEYVCLHIVAGALTKEMLLQCREQFADLIGGMQVDENHMSSLFTVALICTEEPDENALATLQKLKFHKDFRFTLRGWADLAVVVIDLKHNRVYSNSKGKANKHNFEYALESLGQ